MRANEALMKLKSKGALLRVDFAVTFASFSFEGYIADLDDSTVVIEAPHLGQESPPTFTLSALQISTFDGDFREDESGMFLTLMVTRPIAHSSEDLFRFHIVGDWSPKGRHIM